MPTDPVNNAVAKNNSGQVSLGSGTLPPEPEINLDQALNQVLDSAVKNKTGAETSTSPASPSKLITVKDLHDHKNEVSKGNLRSNTMTTMTVVGAGMSLISGLSKIALGAENGLSQALDSLTDKASTAAFAGFGLFGTSDSTRRKYGPQLLAQMTGVLTPLFSNSNDLTMNRGIEVGLANAAADIEKLGGGKKKGYENFSESMSVFNRAMGKYFKSLKANPFKTLFDYKSGTSGITTGILTGIAPIIHALGLKKLAAVMRQGGGIAVEFASKLNADNLKKGRLSLFASGLLMTVSSALNLMKEFLPERMHKGLENFTWAFNLAGKQAQIQAYNSGELAYSSDKNYSWSELPGKMMRAVLGYNGLSKDLKYEDQLKQLKALRTMAELEAKQEQETKLQEAKSAQVSTDNASSLNRTYTYRPLRSSFVSRPSKLNTKSVPSTLRRTSSRDLNTAAASASGSRELKPSTYNNVSKVTRDLKPDRSSRDFPKKPNHSGRYKYKTA